MTVLAIVLFTVSLAVALAGIALPFLPGVPVAAIGAAVAAWLVGLEQTGAAVLWWALAIAILGQGVDFAAGVIGARVYGARRAGVWGGVIGSLVGIFVVPPWGIIFGGIVGAIGFELLAGRELREALRAGFGAFVGALGGAVAKLVLLVALAVAVYPRLV